jgi:hypothetical protein
VVARNEITGDAIQSRGNSKKFKENLDKIKPSCYNDCTYLVNTLTKCRVCSWKGETSSPKYSEDWQSEERDRAIAQNGNVGYE